MKTTLPFREISSFVGMSADECWKMNPPPLRAKITQIRRQKAAGQRKRPSDSVRDQSQLLNAELRKNLMDHAAALVDENIFGRSEMCMQFADLLVRSLTFFGLPARAVVGRATYQGTGGKWFEWDHAWVLVNDELIDANLDSLDENPFVPADVRPRPYWGVASSVPVSHRYIENPRGTLPKDDDVDSIWWPDFLEYLKQLQR